MPKSSVSQHFSCHLGTCSETGFCPKTLNPKQRRWFKLSVSYDYLMYLWWKIHLNDVCASQMIVTKNKKTKNFHIHTKISWVVYWRVGNYLPYFWPAGIPCLKMYIKFAFWDILLFFFFLNQIIVTILLVVTNKIKIKIKPLIFQLAQINLTQWHGFSPCQTKNLNLLSRY